MTNSNNILWFKEISIEDTDKVGGKNASLGEMYSNLTEEGVKIPNGFAVTASAYRKHLEAAEIKKDIKGLLLDLDISDLQQLEATGEKIRKMIYKAKLPAEIKKDIKEAFSTLEDETEGKLSVGVRSSATAEDLPRASFAGQQDSFLNISEEKYLIRAVKKAMASIYTDRAISYRENQAFDHLDIACSVGIQKMVNAEQGSAGVMFTVDTESGFEGVTLINSSYGFGEYVVKGEVNSDQFYVFKEGLKQGKPAIISKEIGSKEKKLIQGKNRDTKQQRVKTEDREKFSLEDEDVLQLARWGTKIEEYYGRPQDIEWAKDGETGELYVLQARPETVESQKKEVNIIEDYELKQTGEVLLTGTAVGTSIDAGEIKKMESVNEEEFNQGDVLVTEKTSPGWEPIMNKASAIVTDQGGKTSHAAIVSRELGVPAVVGTRKATKRLEEGNEITVDCSQGGKGFIYKGKLPFEVHRRDIGNSTETATNIRINISNPDQAFNLQKYPNDGVGLARTEFIFNDSVKIHPLAAVNYEEIENKKIKSEIDEITTRYENKKQYCVDKLASGIAKIAAAFYPKETIVRFSDFKSNEYKELLGGSEFEPEEENPMLGWRGASRYYSDKYKPAFKLECKAIKKAREEWGLDNIVAMIPFCRTPEEGRKVLDSMSESGLKRERDGLDVYAMCELPSNVVLADKFARLFDGISIGSNDLTQLILGVDKESSRVNKLYDENNEAVKDMISKVIKTTHKYEKPIGICGQAPSDSLEFSEFLVREGVDSISINPDSLIKTKAHINEIEKTVGNTGDKTNSKLLLLLLALGILSAIIILLGSSCSTSTNLSQKSAINKEQAGTNYNPAKIRKRAEQRVRKEQKQKLKQKMLPMKISTFADFNFEYPYGWKVSHSQNSLRVYDSNTDKYISFMTTSSEKRFEEVKNKYNNVSSMKVDQKAAFLTNTSTSNTSTVNNRSKEFYLAQIKMSTSSADYAESEKASVNLLTVESNDREQLNKVIETMKFNEKNN